MSQAKRILSILLIFQSVFIAGCPLEQQSEPISDMRFMLSTVCTITLYDTQDRAILSEAFELCAYYESLFSISETGSDIWRINQAGGVPVEVSVHTLEIIKTALVFCELSDGMFDITIGRLSWLWDFTGQTGIPSESEVADALATVDYRQLRIVDNTVQLLNPETWLDLGGIAKGYIADRLADFLREKGVTSAVVDLGGNVITVGLKPKGASWLIGIARPFSAREDLIGVLHTGEATVVTAGIYERQFVSDGELYHHILDPSTGMPAQSNVVSATIVSTSSMEADALSTIFLLMGIDDGTGAIIEEQLREAYEYFKANIGLLGIIIIVDDGRIIKFGEFEFEEID